MNMVKKIVTIVLGLFLSNSLFAHYYIDEVNKNHNQVESRAANCSPSVTLTTLELNNVRALIETGGEYVAG